jgi:predicted nucleotidyltransferase
MTEQPSEQLPDTVSRLLSEFVDEAKACLGSTLSAVVLFGSAAENRLRKTSDVNVVVVLAAFEPQAIDRLRATIQRARSAVRLEVMWLLEREVPQAADAFAVKFTDIVRRRRVLFGTDPFVTLSISRQATLARLRQVLLNQILRLRAGYATDGGHEERVALRIAEAAGPLRVSAAELLEIESGARLAPRDALLKAGEGWQDPIKQRVFRAISQARETRQIEAGSGSELLVGLIGLTEHLYQRATALS